MKNGACRRGQGGPETFEGRCLPSGTPRVLRRSFLPSSSRPIGWQSILSTTSYLRPARHRQCECRVIHLLSLAIMLPSPFLSVHLCLPCRLQLQVLHGMETFSLHTSWPELHVDVRRGSSPRLHNITRPDEEDHMEAIRAGSKRNGVGLHTMV